MLRRGSSVAPRQTSRAAQSRLRPRRSDQPATDEWNNHGRAFTRAAPSIYDLPNNDPERNMTMLARRCATVTLLLIAGAPALGAPQDSAAARAAATEAAMTDDERTTLTYGVMAVPLGPPVTLPADAVPGAGYVAGIPRLNVPSLRETDASLGVSYVLGLRKDGATALPSGMLLGSTWNREILRAGGAMIGSEAKAKGFNVMLAGGMNLIREPRGGRTFEYLSEDPLLSGLLGGASIAGIQSNGIISTIKHYALNNQETARSFIDIQISEAAARESDLLAFQIGIEQGKPGSVMCSYNQINGAYGCDNDTLLNKVLKKDWGYKGFVMSDWGAVPRLEAALHGLDQQSGAQLDPKVFFGKPLAEAAASNPAYKARVTDMNRRVLYAIYANGVDKPTARSAIDFKANALVAEATAKEGIVLLRNRGNALPLSASAKSIAVIGGYADTGVLSGAGSSQVHGQGGPAVVVPMGGDGPLAAFISQQYHRSPPLKALKARAPATKFTFRDGRYIADAVQAAKKADVAIVFATQWASEGFDLPDLTLPNGQDALIAAVAAANPNTIVILETGGPVLMPWLDQTAAVVEAWYPGARGGEAIAAVLYGDTNPSGRLPVTFPASLDQLPFPVLPGSDTLEPDFQGRAKPGETLSVDYNRDGSDVGYRWFARTGAKPLFAFGYGLSYTSFAHSALAVSGDATLTAKLTVVNTGTRDGADVPQLYLVNAAGKSVLRLAAFDKVALKAGERRTVSVNVDPRLIANWDGDSWRIKAGTYSFALGSSATALGPVATITLAERRFKP
jgi:beta-glucosidase